MALVKVTITDIKPKMLYLWSIEPEKDNQKLVKLNSLQDGLIEVGTDQQWLFTDDLIGAVYGPISLVDTAEKHDIEQRIIGIEMLIDDLSGEHHGLYDSLDLTANFAYDFCDELFGDDSQHIRRKDDLVPCDKKKREYFSYCPDSGFDKYDTINEARDSAQSSIDYFRDEASEGWNDEVTGVCWGEIKQSTVMFNEKPLTDEVRSELNIVSSCDTYCDYQLA